MDFYNLVTCYVQEWPLRSKLDAEVYGPQESKITTELIEKQLAPYEYTFRDVRRKFQSECT